jgi:hypothetical protein
LSRVKVGRCETFDSSATPKAGAKVKRPKLGPINLPALNEKIQETVERAKQDDPHELRANLGKRTVEIGRLNRKIEELEHKLTEERPPTLTEEERDAVRRGLMASENARDSLRDMVTAADDAQKLIGDFADAVKLLIDPEVAATRTPSPKSVELDGVRHVEDANAGSSTLMVDTKKWDAAKPNGSRRLKGGERKILTALAQFGAMNKRRLAALTGYKMSGGGFQNLLSGLRTCENITRGESIYITAYGVEALGHFDLLPTGEALLDMWVAKLGRAPRLCLEALHEAWPQELTRERLAELTGYAAGGGGFSNALSRLNTLGLIDRTGSGLKATDNLFA